MHKTDVAAIEKAHKGDIEATLTQDPKKLIDLWAEDAVTFIPGSPPAVGKQAIEAEHEKFHSLKTSTWRAPTTMSRSSPGAVR